MKIYELTSPKKALTHIITYPEQPDSDMVLIDRAGKSIILNSEIVAYLQGAFFSELIGKNLAQEIASDYPHLFQNKSLDFTTPVINSDSTSLFSNMGERRRSEAQAKLSKIDEKIKKYPDNFIHKIDRAELLLSCEEHAHAKLEFEAVLPLVDGYYKRRIKKGLEQCKVNPVKQIVIYQTPFKTLSLENTESLLHCGENDDYIKAELRFEKMLPFCQNNSEQKRVKDGLAKCRVYFEKSSLNLQEKSPEKPAKPSEAGLFKQETATIYPISGNLSAKLKKSGNVGYKFILIEDDEKVMHIYLTEKNAKIVAEKCNKPLDLVLALKEIAIHESIIMSEIIEGRLKTGAAYSK